jgi:uncharacterized membrane protein
VNRSPLGCAEIGAALFAVLGCTSASPVSCPNDSPACPSSSSSAPTYQADVGPLIQKYCAGCHSPDGGNPALLLQTFEDVTATKGMQITHVLSRFKACVMPPADAPQPTSAERTVILTWFACCETNGGTCAR